MLLKTPAITLKSRKWGEADRIVTFFTLQYGKLRGVARGARRIRSRFGSALEPFVHCDLNLFEKHNDPLYRITQVDIRETFPQLREDLALMSAAARMLAASPAPACRCPHSSKSYGPGPSRGGGGDRVLRDGRSGKAPSSYRFPGSGGKGAKLWVDKIASGVIVKPPNVAI